eukprot:13838809-Alexandrium_andersonii.AAC.1
MESFVGERGSERVRALISEALPSAAPPQKAFSDVAQQLSCLGGSKLYSFCNIGGKAANWS